MDPARVEPGRGVRWLPLIPMEAPPAPAATPAPRPDHLSLASAPAGRRAAVTADVSLALAKAVERFDGLAWAGKLPANGNREAAVLIPRGTDLGRPVELFVLFHGNGGTVASYTKWLAPTVAGLPAQGRNAVVVIPGGGAKASWMVPGKGESLVGVQDQALAQAKRLAGRPLRVASHTVAGFSGGGQAIAQAATAGELRADKIVFFDATYGDWGDTAARHRRPGARVDVFYTEHNRLRAERLRGLAGIHVEASTTDHGGTLVKYFYR